MILYNPNDFPVEFRYDGKVYIVTPHASQTFSDKVADHALKRSKVPLVEYSPIYDKEMLATDMDYGAMTWGQLKSLGSARRIFKPGMKKEELLAGLDEYDRQTGALQKSSGQEEGAGA